MVVAVCGALVTTEPSTPFSVQEIEGEASMVGAYLLSRVKLSSLEKSCRQIPNHIKLAHDATLLLIKSQFVKHDSNFAKSIAFLLIKLESNFVDIYAYVNNLNMCSSQQIRNIKLTLNQLQTKLNIVWNNLGRRNHTTPKILNAARPLRIPPVPTQFPTLLVGLGLGALGGALGLGSLWYNSKPDIDTINRNILKTNKRVKLTNNRIDVLA